MKVLSLILWLLLGVFYWWMWGNNEGDCCQTSSVNSEMGALTPNGKADSLNASLDINKDSIPTDEEDLDGDGIPDSEQDFSKEDVSSIDLSKIDPNESASDVAKVVETENTARIYFPYNSTYKIDSKAIEEYLNKVAQRLKQSGEHVQLTGHGDIVGTDNSNIQIGQYRANTIRDYLVGKGVNPQQIKALSKGRFNPIASNKTREGRAKNRRVELVITKN